MKHKPKQEEYETGNTIQLGDLAISSNNLSMENLVDVLLFLLEQQQVKDYLIGWNKKKLMGGGASYFG